MTGRPGPPGASVLAVGVLGPGTIGGGVLNALRLRQVPGAVAVGVAGRDPQRAAETLAAMDLDVPVVDRVALVRRSDVVVEAASAEVYPELLFEAQELEADIVALSACGIAAHPEAVAALLAAGQRVHIPSAAVAGLDALLAGACGRLSSVKLEITRPVAGLAGTPLVRDTDLDLSSIRAPRVVFQGTPWEACRLMPGKVNIAVAVGLAAGSLDACQVEVVAVPDRTHHSHRVIAQGDFGRVDCVLAFPAGPLPGASNVMTMSVLALLRKLTGGVTVGT